MECGLKRALLISTLLLVGSGTTIALDTPGAPRERTILVSIFDKNGHPVRQLSSDTIQVAENGQPVKILQLRPANDSAILFTVLVDRSKWAHQEKTSAALDGVVDFLSTVVRKDDRIVIATFSDRFHYGDPTSDLVQAKKEITNLNWGTRSAFYDALVQLPVAMSFQPVPGRHIVILLTVGNDSGSKASLNDAIASVRASGIVIFAIDTRYVRRKRAGFEEEQRLAEESGGRCFEFVSDKELQNAFKTIQASIENQYFLTYAPVPGPHAKIRVRAEDVRVFAPRRR